MFPEFLADLNEIFSAGASNQTIANYVMLRRVESWLYITDSSVREARRKLFRDRGPAFGIDDFNSSDVNDCKDHIEFVFDDFTMER